jgi:hypothetical protein
MNTKRIVEIHKPKKYKKITFKELSIGEPFRYTDYFSPHLHVKCSHIEAITCRDFVNRLAPLNAVVVRVKLSITGEDI